MWKITEENLESIALGTGILGTGGGFNPYIGSLRARQVIRKYGPVPVLLPEELTSKDKIVCVGGIGAPTVDIEKIRGTDSFDALRAMEKQTKTRATALISGEIGGGNSMEPIIAGAIANLPIVDADGMGRAFPELQMMTFFMFGVSHNPTIICDEKGNVSVFTHAISPLWMERMSRAVCVQMGSIATWAFAPMNAEDIQRTAIPNTMSLAKELGESIMNAQRGKTNPINAIFDTIPGRILFQGKIVDVERRIIGGFTRGNLTIEGMHSFTGQSMGIDFQNENLIAKISGQTVCTVPDLICIVDTERGEPITTELLKYGFRISVLGLPAPKLLTKPEALAVIGPRAFGYDEDFTPLEIPNSQT